MSLASNCTSLECQERIAALEREIARGPGRRKHTHEWYEQHYGKLHDWARTVLPPEYRDQFFSCVANGSYDQVKDVGKPYKSVAGFMVTPTGYFKMDTAQEQILFDQCVRAEDAEAERDDLLARYNALVGIYNEQRAASRSGSSVEEQEQPVRPAQTSDGVVNGCSTPFWGA